jgi:DNA-directed RNA polymerase subunit RPC12/RpoP
MKRYKDEFETVREESWMGSGISVKRKPPTVEIVDPGSTEGWRDTPMTIRIEQTLKLSVEVLIPLGGHNRSRCEICMKATPLPDAEGAQFILQNCDGGRLCFPHEEDCEEERDSYPATGWKRVMSTQDEEVLACPECSSKISAAIRDVVEKMRNGKTAR